MKATHLDRCVDNCAHRTEINGGLTLDKPAE